MRRIPNEFVPKFIAGNAVRIIGDNNTPVLTIVDMVVDAKDTF
jgi:hypothetical protein